MRTKISENLTFHPFSFLDSLRSRMPTMCVIAMVKREREPTTLRTAA